MTEQAERPTLTPEQFTEIQNSPEFAELRRRFRRFAFPLTVGFLAWYLLYVLLSTYASDFMSKEVFGNVNVGIVLGLLQFVSTFVITTMYVRHANKNTDPIADKIRAGMEGHDDA